MADHDFQRARFTGNLCCTRCNLVPVGPEDDEEDCQPDIDRDARYTHDRMQGVAFWIDRYCADHAECVLAVMVGDDHRHHVDLDDLTEIDDDDYCGGCGQTGCAY